MDASKRKYTQTLKDHLQQQQEPFSLQKYIIERSYMFKNSSNNTHGLYSAKNLRKWSTIKYDHYFQKIRKGILHAKGTLGSLLYNNNSDDQYFAQTEDEGKVLAYEHHSSTDLVNMFQTFTLPTLARSSVVDTGYKPYWIIPKEQHNTRSSKLKEPLPNAEWHLRTSEGPVTSFVGDPVFFTYLRKLLVNSSNILKLGRPKKEKLDKMAEKTSSPCKSRRRNQRDREFYLKEGNKSFVIKADSSMSEEEFGSVVVQKRFRFLEKQCRQVRKMMAQMLYTESSVTSQEWKNLQIVNSGEILMEIGDAILDDIIVTEITDSF